MTTRTANPLDPVRDLLLGTTCLGCAHPGRLVCDACAAGLADLRPARATPRPHPPDLHAPWAGAAYDGLVRQLVVGLKERGQVGLARWQAALLAPAVAALVRDADPAGTSEAALVLVPVPSRRRTVRSRGLDATAVVARRAAARLRAEGKPVLVAPLLRLRGGVVDQSGLDGEGRRANLRGAMTCPAGGLAALARRTRSPVRVVVTDDVLTTGSTLAEAQRALHAVGLPVLGAATVAATRRGDEHLVATDRGVHSESSGERLSLPR